MRTNSALSRRQMLGAAGVAGAGLLIAGRTPVGSVFGGDPAYAASCVALTPTKEIGPYFVEEKLNRSNVTTDPDTGVAVVGVPLSLTLTLLDEDAGCAPLEGAQFDIWHAAPTGLYSDESGEGTLGKKWLRGYQVSDASGKVSFTTVYPGWYSGRAVHIHARIRQFDSTGNATYDFLTQLFFDDSLSDTVYTRAPYSSRGARDTRDAADRVYGSNGASVLLDVVEAGSGYAATFTFGLSPSNAGSGTSTTTTSASTVAATLAAASCTRGALGTRTLHARISAKESVSLDVRLLRGSTLVARKKVATLGAGKHTVNVPLGRSVGAGRATLSVTAKDANANTKVLTRILSIPARSV
jgi:protocatechuate 3,4-dioxygenase beta subunit